MYNSLLLTGDGTNLAQNNTFVDSSTNNFAITQAGNTTQGTFSPYGANWSDYTTGVSGTTNKIDVSSGSAIGGSGVSYTMEGWYFFTSASSGDNQNLFATGNSVFPNRWVIDVEVTSTTLRLRVVTESNSILFNGTTVSIPLNTWVHLAVVNNNSANSFTFYVNGTAAGSRAAVNLTSTSTYQLFCNSTAVTHTLPFYVSNYRIVNGAAVYTGNFTPSTVPLTAISGTTLLLKSNRFVDSSGSGTTITTNGTHSIQLFSPFEPTAAYSTSTIGGSGYFDGSGDYLSAPSNAALTFGTGDFTVEFWVYLTANAPNFCKFYATGTSANNFTIETQSTTNTLAVTDYTATVFFTSSTALTLNTWTHVAVSRSGTAMKLFQNGTQVGSSTNSTNFAGSTALIGSVGSTAFVTGYISDVRVVKGTAVYTTTFTPPTAPLTAVANTSLLLNYTNGGIIDNAMMNNLETVGDTKISTAQSKFGGSSMLFDGTGDTLLAPASVNLFIGTGDFTLEGWIYPTSGSTNRAIISFGNTNTFYLNTSSIPCYGIYFVSDVTLGTTPVSLNTWTHIAFVRSGTTLTCFLNGVSVGTTTTASSIGSASAGSYIGSSQSGNYWFGYLDDLRVTKGYARYTATFTPPTAALPTY